MNDLNISTVSAIPVADYKFPVPTNEFRAAVRKMKANKSWIQQMISDGFVFIYSGPDGDPEALMEPKNYHITTATDPACSNEDQSTLLLVGLSYQLEKRFSHDDG